MFPELTAQTWAWIATVIVVIAGILAEILLDAREKKERRHYAQTQGPTTAKQTKEKKPPYFIPGGYIMGIPRGATKYVYKDIVNDEEYSEIGPWFYREGEESARAEYQRIRAAELTEQHRKTNNHEERTSQGTNHVAPQKPKA